MHPSLLLNRFGGRNIYYQETALWLTGHLRVQIPSQFAFFPIDEVTARVGAQRAVWSSSPMVP
jgi:hypothetical protein